MADTLETELEVIYTRQWRLLVEVTFKVLGCRSLAGDVIQGAFLKLWESRAVCPVRLPVPGGAQPGHRPPAPG
ncbi:hypothetical protein [Azotobacter armeniacus]